jgi:hypothetical protein
VYLKKVCVSIKGRSHGGGIVHGESGVVKRISHECGGISISHLSVEVSDLLLNGVLDLRDFLSNGLEDGVMEPGNDPVEETALHGELDVSNAKDGSLEELP